jgi:selenocysteine lyase/cysteine desulfurase
VGVLYIRNSAQPKIWASVISAYPGGVGISKTFESFGQRDEPAIMAFGEALNFQTKIGRKVIQDRSQELARALMEGLRKIEGVKLWTSPDPELAGPVVTFQPGNLNATRLAATLYEKDRIGCAGRDGADRGGLRFSPHFYNLNSEVDRIIGAVRRHMTSGV